MASFQQPAVAVSTRQQAEEVERSLAADNISSSSSIQPIKIGNGNDKHMGVEAGACESFIGL